MRLFWISILIYLLIISVKVIFFVALLVTEMGYATYKDIIYYLINWDFFLIWWEILDIGVGFKTY